MSKQPPHVYEVASGDICLWADPCGAIFLKTRNQSGDPVELGMDQAMELAEILTQLVKEVS
jgi:hypothetical protein